MELSEITAKMSPIEAITAIVALLVCLSVASERLVEIIKGVIPFLNQQNGDEKKEGWRKAGLQALAVGAGIATAFLAWPALKEVLPGSWTKLSSIFALGFLASGGSGLWNGVLTYLKNVKDIKKEEVNIKKEEVKKLKK